MYQSNLSEDDRKLHFVKRRAKTMFQAALRRDRDGVLLHDDSYQRGMSKRFHFGLALKETDQPVKFKKELYNTLKREYAIRYLEAIGATPTPKMIKMIQDQQPLKEEMVSAAWKSRGGLDDRLYIAPHFHKPPEQEEMLKGTHNGGDKGKGKRRGKSSTSSSAQSNSSSSDNNNNNNGEMLNRKRVTIGGVVQDVGGVAVNLEYNVPPMDPEEAAFDLLKRKYIYPFNTPANPRFDNLTEDDDILIENKEDEGETSNNVQSSATDSNNVLGSSNRRTDAEQLIHELRSPLETTMKQVELMQKRFLNTFPFDRLQHKMKDGEFKFLTSLVLSDDMKRLIGLTSHYLYFTSFRTLTGTQYLTKPLTKERRQATFTAIVKCFSNLEQIVTKNKHDRMLLMALIMLSLRLALEVIYRAAFPMWFNFESFVTLNFWSGANGSPTRDEILPKDGSRGGGEHNDENNPMDPRLIEVMLETMHVGPLGATLTVLNSVVTEMLDGKQYYGRISSLESTGEGIRILSQANRLRSRASARPDTSGVQRAKSPDGRQQHLSPTNGEKAMKTKRRARTGRVAREPGTGKSDSQNGRNSRNPRARASTAPTSPDMMLGGRFHEHVMEMDELRTRQVSTRSSASTRSAGYATSGLVQSVFSSPSAPRARQILRRGENGGRPRSRLHRRIGSPTKSYKDKEKMMEETWVMELKRRKKNARASKHHTRSRTTTRPTLTAAGKAFLHDIAVDRVKSRYKHGMKSTTKTTRMRMLSKLGV
jgi:hypothetical protein